jgi:hypothetical protein
MGEQRGEGESLREEDVRAFFVQLEKWGESLPELDRALLRLLMARAEGSIPLQEELSPVSVKGHYLPPLDVLAPRVLEQLVRDYRLGPEGDVWVQFGPVWLQSTEWSQWTQEGSADPR